MNCTCSKQGFVSATILWISYNAGNVVTSYVSQKKTFQTWSNFLYTRSNKLSTVSTLFLTKRAMRSRVRANEFGYLFLNLLKTKPRRLYLKTQSVPRCKHFSSRL